jgi:hypothetical protein
MSDNGSSPFMEVQENVSMTAGWTLPQVNQFYVEMTRRLSALMTLLESIPISEMKAVNERLRAGGVLSLPQEVSAEQARAWMINLQRDNELYVKLMDVMAHLRNR